MWNNVILKADQSKKPYKILKRDVQYKTDVKSQASKEYDC